MENIVATFNFMKGEGIKIVNIDSTDIVQGNMKLILGLIWTLIFNYQVRFKPLILPLPILTVKIGRIGELSGYTCCTAC
jgi:hypothetical protein